MSPTNRPAGMSAPERVGSGSTPAIGELLGAFAAMAEDMDLDTVLERVTSAACQLVDARFGALGVVGPDRMLSQFVTVGLDDGEIRRIGSLPQGHGVLGLLITDPQPLRLHDLREHPRAVGFPSHHPRMTSFLGVPIRIHGTVFGNLYLTEKNGGEDFSETDEQLLVALATAAGVAIENSRLYDDATRRTRWLEGGLNAARELLEQDDVLRNDFEVLTRQALSASQSTIAVVLRDFGHDRGLICEAAEGEQAAAYLGRSTADSELLQDLTETSEPLVLSAEDAARVLPEARAGGIDALMCGVLTGTEDRRFLLIGRSAASAPFTGMDHEMMRSFTSHVSLALELLGAHRRREQQAVFGDRDRIARDLHDLVIQRLFAAGLSIQGLRKYLTDSEPLDRITAVTAELDSTIRELRDTIYSLRSVPQITATFTSSLFALVAEAFEGHELEPVMQLSGPLDAVVDEDLAAHVRAILLEGLSNALRHADASSITIMLRATSDRLELVVTDDGRGFEQTTSTGGLANMRRRADLCGADLGIVSAPGQGTVVSFSVPLTA